MHARNFKERATHVPFPGPYGFLHIEQVKSFITTLLTADNVVAETTRDFKKVTFYVSARLETTRYVFTPSKNMVDDQVFLLLDGIGRQLESAHHFTTAVFNALSIALSPDNKVGLVTYNQDLPLSHNIGLACGLIELIDKLSVPHVDRVPFVIDTALGQLAKYLPEDQYKELTLARLHWSRSDFKFREVLTDGARLMEYAKELSRSNYRSRTTYSY